jgi:regulatory protein
VAEHDTEAELRARALRLLARREHSQQELERKLSARAGSSEALRTLVSELKTRNQLSEARFAEERARWLARKYGAAKIRQDLQAKGVPEELIARFASPQDQLQKAREILERKYRSPAATREEKAKRARFLQSRGFSSEIIFKLLSARDAA